MAWPSASRASWSLWWALFAERILQFILRSLSKADMVRAGHSQRHRHSLHFSEALARKLELETELVGHDGCVNRLAWNEDGSMLASGSDDRRVRRRRGRRRRNCVSGGRMHEVPLLHTSTAHARAFSHAGGACLELLWADAGSAGLPRCAPALAPAPLCPCPTSH